jgi:hypothetical protein
LKRAGVIARAGVVREPAYGLLLVARWRPFVTRGTASSAKTLIHIASGAVPIVLDDRKYHGQDKWKMNQKTHKILPNGDVDLAPGHLTNAPSGD